MYGGEGKNTYSQRKRWQSETWYLRSKSKSNMKRSKRYSKFTLKYARSTLLHFTFCIVHSAAILWSWIKIYIPTKVPSSQRNIWLQTCNAWRRTIFHGNITLWGSVLTNLKNNNFFSVSKRTLFPWIVWVHILVYQFFTPYKVCAAYTFANKSGSSSGLGGTSKYHFRFLIFMKNFFFNSFLFDLIDSMNERVNFAQRSLYI